MSNPPKVRGPTGPVLAVARACAPPFPAGVSHVMVVSFTTTTLVAETPSKVTVFVPGELFWKPVPVRDTLVAPREVPLEGATEVKLGSG